MGKIVYCLSKKSNQGKSEVILDVQPARGCHYRLKSGVFIDRNEFEYFLKTGKLSSVQYLGLLEKKLLELLPKDRESAESILATIKTSDDLIVSFEHFIESRMVEKGLTDGTMEMYRNVKMLLKAYTDNVSTSVKVICKQWLVGLVGFMSSGKRLSNSTQQNYWRLFKVYLTYLVENEVIDSSVLMFRPKFKQPENDVIWLTQEELIAMKNLVIEKERYAICRDLFLIQCMTGVRFSDLVNFRESNIHRDRSGAYVSILTKKTTSRLKIYLNSTCCSILEHYGWNLPDMSKDYYNIALPEIARAAGISGKVEITKMVGNERVITVKERWELVKSHTARRTFICQAINSGVNNVVIRSITGHKQMSSFQRYVNISDKKKADVAKNVDFLEKN